MTYTQLTTSELVMRDESIDNGISVLKIVQSLKRSRQTNHKVVTFLKAGQSANDYYRLYKANKSRCGRRQTILSRPYKNLVSFGRTLI